MPDNSVESMQGNMNNTNRTLKELTDYVVGTQRIAYSEISRKDEEQMAEIASEEFKNDKLRLY